MCAAYERHAMHKTTHNIVRKSPKNIEETRWMCIYGLEPQTLRNGICVDCEIWIKASRIPINPAGAIAENCNRNEIKRGYDICVCGKTQFKFV